jgi:sarcosine oxidase
VKRFQTIVLGLGAMGSAAVHHLAKGGNRVLGLDRFSPPHARGSSHGESRITRLAIGEGEHFTPLVLRSHELWRELERATGASLLTRTGGLFISSAARSSVLHVADFFANTVAAAVKHGIVHEILDARAIRQRFPQFDVADDEFGYFEHEAGYLRPEACIRAHLETGEALGAEIHRGETVRGFDAGTPGVTVVTDHGRYDADRLIIAAGSWLPSLTDRRLARHFKVYRQLVCWFDVEGAAEPFLPPDFPVFIWELQGRTQGIYGIPAIDGPRGGVKVGAEQFEIDTSADADPHEVTEAEITGMHERLVAPFLPGLSPRGVKAVTCLYTVTPDFGFVIDLHPDSERVLIVAACSGHGFKHSPAIGEAAAAWASGGTMPFGIDAFGLARFGEPPQRIPGS